MKYLMMLWVLALLAVVVAGCSGGTSTLAPPTSTLGAARVTIHWPDASRLIPAATNSITVSLYRDSTAVASKIVVRPTGASSTTVTFPELPVGELRVLARAYPESGGQGVAQAAGDTLITVEAGKVTPFAITMASTIATLVLTPAESHIRVGQTVQLVATTYDSEGRVVLVAPNALQWSARNAPGSTADGTVVQVDTTGKVTGEVPGVGEITVCDSESGKRATALVAVAKAPPTSITISPESVVLEPEATYTFCYTSYGVPNAPVQWCVEEANGGTVTENGVYTAPQRAGIYHVVVSSVVDPHIYARATVIVKAKIILTPLEVSVSIGGTVHFSALTNHPDPRIEWRVEEGAVGGLITGSGVYQAPMLPGVYHVVARLYADPAVSARATVTVQKGGVIVVIE